MQASRSWRSCRSSPSRSLSTTPTAGSCARRCRPEPRDARRQPASSPSSRRTRTTTRPCMTMPRCRTCSASHGTASLKSRADAALAFADKTLAAAKTDQARARAGEQKQKAALKAAEAGTQRDTAKADAKAKLDAAAAAKDAAKAAEKKKVDLAKAA